MYDKYLAYELNALFPVTHLIALFYRGLPKERTIDDYTANTFWELFYVDRGNISLNIDGRDISLSAGQGVFYKPRTNHRMTGSTASVANVASISFLCPDLDEKFFGGKICTFDHHEKKLLHQLIVISNEHLERQSNKHDGPKGMRPKKGAPAHVPSFIKAILEYLLLYIYTRQDTLIKGKRIHQKQATPMVNSAIEYMYNNINEKISIHDLAKHVNMSDSRFRTLFKNEIGQSVIDYFNDIKMEHAKTLIRDDNYTFSEIAMALGFSSESYFSRQFKLKTGMTPSEYSQLLYVKEKNK